MVVDKAILEKLIKAGVKYVKAELKKDAANLYSLKADWTLPLVKRAIPDYADEAFCILSDGEKSLIVVKAFESTPEHPHCDGASCAPDEILGVDIIPAAVFHDRWYEDMANLSAAFGWTGSRVRKLGDEIFASIIYAENGCGFIQRFIATLYYRAVRAFGGLYHKHGGKLREAVRVLVASVALTALAGCGGCVGTLFDDGDTYEPPEVDKVAADTISPAWHYQAKSIIPASASADAPPTATAGESL